MGESTSDRITDAEGGYLETVTSLATSVLVAIRSSFLGFVVAVGVVFLVISVLLSGYVLESVQYGLLAGMTFIWGVSAFLYAILGSAILKLIGYS